MARRVRTGTIDQQRVTPAGRSSPVRRILLGAVSTAAALAISAVTSLPSGAATVTSANKPAVAGPGVSPVAVTVPGGTAPPATTTPASQTPATQTPASPTPAANGHSGASAQTGSTPSASTRPASSPQTQTSPAPASASPPAGRPPATRSPSRDADTQQQRLRAIVVRLSQCLSTLNAGSQRLLLLRAGIDMAQPDGRGAVATALRISRAREASVEQAALLQLQKSSQAGTCGSPPVWIHVPAGNRLVPVAVVLINAVQPARGTHASHVPG